MKNFNDKIKALKFIKHLGTKDEILLANGDVINVNDLPGGGGGDTKPDAQGTLTFDKTKKIKLKYESEEKEVATLDNLPTKTSQLQNDSGYLTEHQDISGKADKSEIPTKVSQLENDSGFSNGVITGKYNIVDLRLSQGFDENTFYPVTIAMQDTTIKGSSNMRIRVMHGRQTLSADERPTWMTDSQGVTLCTEWEIGFGDYTIAGFSNRLIYNNQWWYADTNPCRKPVIFQKTNTETFYLRGGGKYDIYTNIDVTINFGASIQLDGSNTLTAIQTDGTTTDIESKVTAFPQEVKKQSTAGLLKGTNKVMIEWEDLQKLLKLIQ